jgi:hypothetical protein
MHELHHSAGHADRLPQQEERQQHYGERLHHNRRECCDEDALDLVLPVESDAESGVGIRRGRGRARAAWSLHRQAAARRRARPRGAASCRAPHDDGLEEVSVVQCSRRVGNEGEQPQAQPLQLAGSRPVSPGTRPRTGPGTRRCAREPPARLEHTCASSTMNAEPKPKPITAWTEALTNRSSPCEPADGESIPVVGMSGTMHPRCVSACGRYRPSLACCALQW